MPALFKRVMKLIVLIGLCFLVVTWISLSSSKAKISLEASGKSSAKRDFISKQDHVPVDWYSAARERMKSRRENLYSVCAKYGMNTPAPMDETYVKYRNLKYSLFFSDKHKFLMCQIPKCASSNQAKFLVETEGIMTKEEIKESSLLRVTNIAAKHCSIRTSLDIFYVTERLENYKKMVIVREPLSRILSAFRNKLENNTRLDSWNKLGWNLYTKYQSGDQKKVNFSKPSPVTMEGFVAFLTDPSSGIDRHWDYYDNLCAPCALDYDFIIHLDTIVEDMKYVTSQFGIQGVDFPPAYDSRTEFKMVKKYYRDVDAKLIRKLYKKYEKDSLLFGFREPPDFLLS